MKTQKISFKGAYRTQIEQKVINNPLFRPNTIVAKDNTRNLYFVMDPSRNNPSISLFTPYNRAKAQLDWIQRPEVILTNDDLGQDAFNHQKEIVEPYTQFENKIKNMSLEELKIEAQRVIAEDKLNISLEETEKFRPEPYHIKPFEAKSSNPKQFSVEEHIKMFLSDYFNTKMFEKEQKFYDGLKIQFLEPKGLISLGKNLVSKIVKVAS